MIESPTISKKMILDGTYCVSCNNVTCCSDFDEKNKTQTYLYHFYFKINQFYEDDMIPFSNMYYDKIEYQVDTRNASVYAYSMLPKEDKYNPCWMIGAMFAITVKDSTIIDIVSMGCSEHRPTSRLINSNLLDPKWWILSRKGHSNVSSKINTRT